jgi:hypothetical protein
MAPIPSNTPDVRLLIVTVVAGPAADPAAGTTEGTVDETAPGSWIAVLGPKIAMTSPPAAAAAAAASRLSCLPRFIVASRVISRRRYQRIGRIYADHLATA